MSTLFPLTLNAWVPIATNDAHVLQSGGIGKAVYQVSATEPAPYADDQPVYNVTTNKTSFEYRNSQEGLTLWAWLTNGNAQVSVTPLLNSGIPDGAYKGFRAQNFQSYDESNKKIGTQWEASKEFTGLSASQRLFTVMKVGPNNPVDLKARILGGTDEGVIGKMYWLNASDIDAYGTPEKWYNFRTDIARTGAQPEVELYIEAEVTFAGGLSAADLAIPARQVAADAFRTTSKVAAAGGVPAAPVGGNRILYENEIVLLEIFSKSAQDATSTLEIYEGGLDLPLP